MAAQPVYRTALRHLERVHEGKVRDIYAVDADSLLIVTTDRLSAFDVVLPDPIPDKGRVLNQMSNFWFAAHAHLVPNHLTGRPARERGAYATRTSSRMLEGRAVIVRQLRALAARGGGARLSDRLGLEGLSSAPDSFCGIALPPGLRQAERLPQPIFTPASKAAAGSAR